MNPLHPTVVTIGSFHAGTAFNVIPEKAELSGTTRTFDMEAWHNWEERMEKVVRGVCESMGVEYDLNFEFGYPPLYNDEEMSAVVRRCAEAVVGQEKTVEPEQTMGGEDMAYYLQKAKGCFFGLGVGYEGTAGIHNPGFIFNEEVLPLGVETFCRVAAELLGT